MPTSKTAFLLCSGFATTYGMTEPTETDQIKRTFQEIPDYKATEAEQTALLSDLGWHNGSGWGDLLRSKRVLIISEAGAGKTYECREQKDRLWDAGEPAFYVELADLARGTLRDLLSHGEDVRFEAWLASQSDVATFFLDSIDELQLSLGSFEQALKRLSKAIAGQLHRVRIVITSRPIPIDAQLFRKILPVPEVAEDIGTSEEFAMIAMKGAQKKPEDKSAPKDWRNVALMPLSPKQMRRLALTEGVTDVDAMFADIKQRHAEEFVRRPQDLIELCADWRDHHRIRTHYDQVASNIAVKLNARTDRPEKAELSPDKALSGARRLALAATLGRKLTLRHSAKADRKGDGSEIPLDPAKILHDWKPEERATLLERALFGFVSYGRVRFHHRSVIEYLAADHLRFLLIERGMPVKVLKRMLFAATAEGIEVVKPSMRPVAAWLALYSESIFEEVLTREPETLLNFGDPESLEFVQRQRALHAYVERYGKGGWRGHRIPYIQLHRFAAPDLAADVRAIWERRIENEEVRELLLGLIDAGKMADCTDIAHKATIDPHASNMERLIGIDALVRLNDSRLGEIGVSIAEDASLWPKRLAEGAIIRLFPDNLSISALSGTLVRLQGGKQAGGGFSWSVPRLIKGAALTAGQLEELRHAFTELVVEEIVWDKNHWPRLQTKRGDLLAALAVTCLQLIKSGVRTPDALRSGTIALHLMDRKYNQDDVAEELKAAFATLSVAERRTAFEVEDAFLETHHAASDAFNRYAQVGLHGALTLGNIDEPWILEMLADHTRDAQYRAMVLEAAIRVCSEGVAWQDYLQGLREKVADLPDLLKRLEDFGKPVPRDLETEALEKKWAKQNKQRERKDAKAHASWVMFWQEIANDPTGIFNADRAGNTAWNLWSVMKRSGDESRSSGWNRRFVERHFGKDVADNLRLAIMKYWRDDCPTLRSEREPDERNTFLVRWQLGLAGIYAEAEDPLWATRLSEDEAALALRYAPLELNGFPAWLGDVAALHPHVVDSVLGAELTAELDEASSDHSMRLQDIQHSALPVIGIFLPRLLAWLDDGKWRLGHNEDNKARISKLRQVVQTLVQHGDEESRGRVLSLANTELAEGAVGPLSDVWLPVLMRFSPIAGVDVLEKTLAPIEPSQFGAATDWFGSLFGDRFSGREIDLQVPRFTPDLLLRLARLAYRHIRRCDDMQRGDGSYSPNMRDHAEHGRSNILHALLEKEGPGAWAAKMELAADPLFADFRDRAFSIALERAAGEADSIAFTEVDVVGLDKYGDLPPQTRNDIFSLMNDRLDDLDDLLLQDTSPRAAWAIIRDEKVLRQQIAHELKNSARHAYKVDQEAVTADEKETDIRLRSTGADVEAVIELKVGEKERSAADLRQTLKQQLVTKYMGPENARAGCLLVTVATDREWRHPDTGEALDLVALIAMLNEEASKIETEMCGSVRLVAKGLDLRPRLAPERPKTKPKEAMQG